MNTIKKEQKLTVRFPDGMLDDLRKMAQGDDRSLNGEIIWLLRAATEQKKSKKGA